MCLTSFGFLNCGGGGVGGQTDAAKKEEQFGKANMYFMAADNIDNRSPIIFLAKALYSLVSGQLDFARKQTDLVLELDPDNLPARLVNASIQFARQEYKGASPLPFFFFFFFFFWFVCLFRVGSSALDLAAATTRGVVW